MVYHKASAEANELKGLCIKKEIRSPTVIHADSLITRGAILFDKGNEEKAYYYMNMAQVYYRLALAQNDALADKRRIGVLMDSLQQVEQELNTYKKVLTELEPIQ